MSVTVCRTLKCTKHLARRIAKQIKSATRDASGCTILLSGEMGAGKTTLVRLVIKALGRRLDKGIEPTSPTFSIINKYAEDVYHIDLYRVQNEKELAQLGLEEITTGDTNLVFIEWPQVLESSDLISVTVMPTIKIKIDILDDTTRQVCVKMIT